MCLEGMSVLSEYYFQASCLVLFFRRTKPKCSFESLCARDNLHKIGISPKGACTNLDWFWEIVHPLTSAHQRQNIGNCIIRLCNYVNENAPCDSLYKSNEGSPLSARRQRKQIDLTILVEVACSCLATNGSRLIGDELVTKTNDLMSGLKLDCRIEEISS
jgi:hypothetical protein